MCVNMFGHFGFSRGEAGGTAGLLGPPESPGCRRPPPGWVIHEESGAWSRPVLVVFAWYENVRDKHMQQCVLEGLLC